MPRERKKHDTTEHLQQKVQTNFLQENLQIFRNINFTFIEIIFMGNFDEVITTVLLNTKHPLFDFIRVNLTTLATPNPRVLPS